jgi:hypothetical protein
LVPKNNIGEQQKTAKVKKQQAEENRRANIEAENARRQKGGRNQEAKGTRDSIGSKTSSHNIFRIFQLWPD